MASVLATYDSKQKFPVFGFGAKSPELGGVSHCFPLNGNPDNPEVDGIEVCVMSCIRRRIHYYIEIAIINTYVG